MLSANNYRSKNLLGNIFLMMKYLIFQFLSISIGKIEHSESENSGVKKFTGYKSCNQFNLFGRGKSYIDFPRLMTISRLLLHVYVAHLAVQSYFNDFHDLYAIKKSVGI